MTEFNLELLKRQQEAANSKKRFKVLAGGRWRGKSRLEASLLMAYALESKDCLDYDRT